MLVRVGCIIVVGLGVMLFAGSWQLTLVLIGSLPIMAFVSTLQIAVQLNQKKADQEAQLKQAKSLRSTKKASMQSWTGQDPTKTRRKYETNLHRKYWR